MIRQVLILGGPTGSGKNRMALELSKVIPSEIVNADSRQIYRALWIGTNRPSEQDSAEIRHHLFGFLSPEVSFSAADYEKLAFPLLNEISARNKIPLVVGGTGFYIKALLKGTWPVAAGNESFRNRLQRIQERRGMPFLYRMLQRLDPETAARLGVNDRYRIIRTLEIFFLSGIRKSQLSQMPDRFPALKFYLNPDRSELIDTIRKRTIAMIAAGWIEEVRTLMVEYPGFADMPAARSLGYHEIIRHLQGEMDRQKCTEIIIERTSQYAKRQLTWFRNQDGFAPLPPREELQQIVESVLQ